MTADELLKEIDECHGPCGEMCLSCPEAHFLKEIREVIVNLMKENHDLHLQVAQANSLIFF